MERHGVVRTAADTEGEWEDGQTNRHVDGTRLGLLQSVAVAGEDDDDDDDLGDELAPIRLHIC